MAHYFSSTPIVVLGNRTACRQFLLWGRKYPLKNIRRSLTSYQYENTSSAAANLEAIPAALNIANFDCKNVRKLAIDVSKFENINVEIFPTWSDQEVNGVLFMSQTGSEDVCTTTEKPNLKFLVEEDYNVSALAGAGSNSVSVTVQDENQTTLEKKAVKARFHVPQMCDIDIVSHSDVSTNDKIEGDVSIRSSNGNITVSKIRGERSNLLAPNGTITIGTCEGMNMLFESETLSAKKLMAKSMNLEASKQVNIGACYVSNAIVSLEQSNVHSDKAITGQVEVHNMHGNVKVVTFGPVNLSGVSGSVDVTSTHSDVNVSIDSLQGDVKIATPIGSTYLSLPELNLHAVTGTVVAKSEEYLSLPEGISTATIEHLNEGGVRYTGVLVEASPSRKKVKTHGGGSGKINYDASRVSVWEGTNVMTKSSNDSAWPVIVHSPNGSVTVNVSGWKDSLRRRFGF